MYDRKYSSLGFVLKRKNYKEADRIVTIYSKTYGKMSALAKGVRKPKSKKRGSLEVFTLIKYSSTKSKGFDIITETEVVDDFKEVRHNLNKITLSYYFIEVIDRLTREGEKNPEVFYLIKKYFDQLKNEKYLKSLRKKFIYDVLIILGFWPSGKKMLNADLILETVIEKKLSSQIIGSKILL